MTDPIRLPVQRDRDLDDEEVAALEEAMSRHPAGRRQRRPRRATLEESGPAHCPA